MQRIHGLTKHRQNTIDEWRFVTATAQSQKLISHTPVHMSLNQFKWVHRLRKKLKHQCPCGYAFETFRSENDAVAMVQLHVERYHKDFLPFGITNAESLTLLKIEYEDIKPKNLKSTFYSVPTQPDYNLKNPNTGRQKSKRKKAQLVENSFS